MQQSRLDLPRLRRGNYFLARTHCGLVPSKRWGGRGGFRRCCLLIWQWQIGKASGKITCTKFWSACKVFGLLIFTACWRVCLWAQILCSQIMNIEIGKGQKEKARHTCFGAINIARLATRKWANDLCPGAGVIDFLSVETLRWAERTKLIY